MHNRLRIGRPLLAEIIIIRRGRSGCRLYVEENSKDFSDFLSSIICCNYANSPTISWQMNIRNLEFEINFVNRFISNNQRLHPNKEKKTGVFLEIQSHQIP